MLVQFCKIIFLLFVVEYKVLSENQDGGHEKELRKKPTRTFNWDSNGYLIYCPCMGRFGNQAEQFLGALAFAKALNRTLILPPWSSHEIVPFTNFFQLDPFQEYHRVLTAEDFMEHLAPQYWPPGSRHGYCWVMSQNNPCIMKKGYPFKNFWDGLNIEFDEFVSYNLPYNVEDANTVNLWNERFPPKDHPVLALRGPPARFPVAEHDRPLQRYLKWSKTIDDESSEYIRKTLPEGPFVGLHLRNGQDWVRACSHSGNAKTFMASPQCLGFYGGHKITPVICLPPKQEIIQRTTRIVRETGAKSVFVATDNDPMLEDLRLSLDPLGVKVFHLNPHLPQIDLAILTKADHFIGNCISTFTAFVKRHRDVQNLPSSFWGFDGLNAKEEL